MFAVPGFLMGSSDIASADWFDVGSLESSAFPDWFSATGPGSPIFRNDRAVASGGAAHLDFAPLRHVNPMYR